MPAEIRLLSWNLHGLRDDRYALTSLVRDLDPDVMCVQESPKFFRWRAKLAHLARDCGLLYVTGGGSAGGTALLAHLRVDVERTAELPLSYYRLGWPDRGVAAAVVRRGGTRLTVASLHLPLPQTERLDHATRALEVIRASGVEQAFAAGDLNERPGHAAWAHLEDEGMRDLAPHSGFTFPSAAPDRRIDGVFGTAALEVVDYRVVDDRRAVAGSDHRPVLITVRVP